VMATPSGDLQAAAERARAAAAEAGELRPARIGKVTTDIPEAIRAAIREDLASGAYQKAAPEAGAGDPDLVQG
jgi:aspartate/methionine/tyrosine aminotransferase